LLDEFRMDVGLIRTSFINSQLDRALLDSSGSLAVKVVREFSRYILWFAHSLPHPEREVIMTKLAQLEFQISERQKSKLG
jgi:hypothetical protein